MANNPDESASVKQLVEQIQQFFSHQIANNNQLSEAAKESLQVATECIEQAYSIERKPASNELFEIYKSHRNLGASAGAGINLGAFANAAGISNPAQMFQNLASTIFTQAAGSANPLNPEATSASASAPPQQQSSSSSTTRTPKTRKRATEAEKMAAESFKNQGNDLMKQDKYKEAYDCYTQAIEIDDNNAVYYSNRAAASSKLGNHQATIDDCQEAIEIDPNYSKAYSRLGFAYASMGNGLRAREAYNKAVELDPENENFRNNLRSAEEQLNATSSDDANAASGASAGGGMGGLGGLGGALGGNSMADVIRTALNNPEIVSMAMRTFQDPRVQNMFGMGGGAQAPGTQQSEAGNQQHTQSTGQQPTTNEPTQQQQQQQQQQATDTQNASATSNNQQQQSSANNNQNQQTNSNPFNPADLLNLTSRLASTANIDIVGAGQEILSRLDPNNPDRFNNMRRWMGPGFAPPQQNNNRQGQDDNDSDRNPPPGYS